MHAEAELPVVHVVLATEGVAAPSRRAGRVVKPLNVDAPCSFEYSTSTPM